MKLLVMILCAGVCWGQQPAQKHYAVSGSGGMGEETHYLTPLKCGKYEYNESEAFSECHGDPKHPDSDIAICTPVVNCKPLIHTLTEKEWQELLEDHARLRSALGHLTKAMEQQSKFDETLMKGKAK